MPAPAVLRTALIFLMLVMSACGFRLMGNRQLPALLEVVFIDLQAPYRVREPPVETHLRALLQRRGATMRQRPGPGVTAIHIQDLNTVREVLSVGSDGKALEFLLRTTVTYRVERDGAVLVPNDLLQISRDFSFNADQVLAKDAEEARLRAYIQTELAELILIRLEARLGRIIVPSPGVVPAVPVPAKPSGA
tara:strand:+ start:97180 stop:97755 length:576 start_codon:yes stop_codon:yes gene_type:complete